MVEEGPALAVVLAAATDQVPAVVAEAASTQASSSKIRSCIKTSLAVTKHVVLVVKLLLQTTISTMRLVMIQTNRNVLIRLNNKRRTLQL